jgi:predicted RNA methylase
VPAATSTTRKVLGQWATPPALVEHVVDIALAGRRWGESPVVLDPACGDGRFLAAVARRLPGARLQGWDVDPLAVTAARRALPGAEVDLLDGLTATGGAVDLVIGNPPFLSQMAAATTRRDGSYADTAVRFVEAGLAMAHRVAMVLPQSVLATRDVAPLRAAVPSLVHLWWGGSRDHFDARVRVCALVIDADAAQGAIGRSGPDFESLGDAVRPAGPSWSPLVADLLGVPGLPDDIDRWPTLGSMGAVARTSFRDEFYALAGRVTDGGVGLPLVTSGAVDAAICHWGTRPVRFAGAHYVAPTVDGSLPRKLAAQQGPKVIVAVQTPTIEAVVDERGSWVPSVPLISVLHPDMWTVAAALLHPVATAWAITHTAGAALTPGTVKLSAGQVAALPVAPSLRGDLVRAAHHDAAGRRDLLREAAIASGCPTDTIDWWHTRLR